MENSNSQIVIYKDKNGNIKIDVRFDRDTVWLTQKMMSLLFQITVPTVNEHVKNIVNEGEVDNKATIRKFRIVQKEGERDVERDVEFYNLDLIIAVGYRVKSKQGTAFRKWATERLSEYIVKGFVIDSERLKNPDLPFDYFEELERTITDIRTSEKRFYRKITDIYATSIDYDPTNDQSILFYKTVQNKVHYAVTGNTAAEIVVKRIDSNKKNLGLTNFRGAKPTKEEILIAKNYYNKEELTQLNALVEQYLIFATEQARRRVPMTMSDWIEKLHGFLTINDRNILQDAGRISHELMKEIAENKFNEYKQIEAKQDVDFDEVALSAIECIKGRHNKIGVCVDSIKYTKANLKDESVIIKLHKLLYEDDNTKNVEKITKQVRSALKNKMVWVAKMNNKIIGYVLCEFFNEKHKYFPNSVFIYGLFVINEYRKKGVGKKLIAMVLNDKYPKQYTYFSITHDPASKHLTKFYESFGFVKSGVTDAGNIILIKNRLKHRI